MTRLELAKRTVIVAVLNELAAIANHEENPGSYGAMASAELAGDVLDEALANYVKEATA